MPSKKFSAEDLREFLESVDKFLHRKHKLVLMGGSALSLGFYGSYLTNDIDAMGKVPSDLERACERARQETGLEVPVSRCKIQYIPDGATRRLVNVFNLHNLSVWTLDPYDIALSKVARGEKKDLDALAELHSAHPLSLSILTERFLKEMNDMPGSERALNDNFLALIDVLFGSEEAFRVRDKLPNYF